MDGTACAFYGFTSQPFASNEGTERYFRTASRAALSRNVVADLVAGRDVIAIEGESGVGKTVLMDRITAELETRGLVVVAGKDASIDAPLIQRLVVDALDVGAAASGSAYRRARSTRGREKVDRVVIWLDDADRIPTDVYCRVLPLVVSWKAAMKQVQLVLTGQCGDWAALGDPGLAALQRQTSARRVVRPLSKAEAWSYLDHKLRCAGRSLRAIMTSAAAAALLEQAAGLPGQIDAMAELVLTRAHLRRCRRIDLPTLQEALFKSSLISTFFEDEAIPRAVRWRRTRGRLAVAASVAAIVMITAGVEINQRETAPGAAGSEKEKQVLLPPPILAPVQPPAVVAAIGAPVAAAGTIAPSPLATAVTADSSAATALREGMAIATISPPSPGNTVPTTAEIDAPRAMPQAAETFGPPVPATPGLVLVAQEGDTMPRLYAQIYHGVTPPPYAAVVAANQGRFEPGAMLVFPAPPAGWARR